MAAGHAQALSRDMDVRSFEQAQLQRVLQVDFRQLAAVHIPDERHAGAEVLLEVAEPPQLHSNAAYLRNVINLRVVRKILQKNSLKTIIMLYL